MVRINWQDAILNIKIGRRSVPEEIKKCLYKVRLRWFGHVVRGDNGNYPRSLFFVIGRIDCLMDRRENKKGNWLKSDKKKLKVDWKISESK